MDPNHLGLTKYLRALLGVRESVLMTTNHHIAMQLAAERQRDLRASGAGVSLASLFARWFGRPLPGRVAGDQHPARGAEAAPGAGFRAPALGEVRFQASRDPHVADPRIRRTAAGKSAAWAPAARQRREPHHGDARVGS